MRPQPKLGSNPLTIAASFLLISAGSERRQIAFWGGLFTIAAITKQYRERQRKAGVDGEGVDWLERVEWWSMEKFMERGFGWALQEQTEEVWRREMEKRKRGEGEEMREKELALIESFAVSAPDVTH